MIALALHGGAGDAAGGADFTAHRAALRDIAAEGAAWLRAGRGALDVVERCVVRLEECPLFNAGVGAVLNRDGLPELDAAIMDGASRACGAVAGVSRIASPVRLARALMESGSHVFLAGAGTFADDASAAISCTGTGEAFIRAGVGHHVHGRMAFSGWELARACEEALELARALGGRGGCIAVGRSGAVALPFNSRVMFRAWLEGERVRVAVGRDDAG
jgi:isoaspartyl peptidase/L-asparaginase-like protein (Ntn-hydrolase superfamily)